MSEDIRFYRTRETHGYMSNFSRHPIELNGRRWPTTEHFFQAMKFLETEHQEAIRRAASPTIAARMGRSRARPLRQDWNSVKEDFMRQALRAKFHQHADLRASLLATGDATLVEHTSNDSYWGDGGDGSGRNRLGALLMEIRDELKREA